jgi:hypothetical protein
MNNWTADLPRIPSAPPDPVALGAAGERPINYNSATGRTLYKQSHMPIGIHAGKIMERVPGGYLVAFRHAFGFRRMFEEEGIDFRDAENRQRWFPVFSYCSRHWDWIINMKETEDERAAQVPDDLPPPPPARDYWLKIPCTLISPDKCHTHLIKYRCEICHDNELTDCTCPRDFRHTRNQARERQRD